MKKHLLRLLFIFMSIVSFANDIELFYPAKDTTDVDPRGISFMWKDTAVGTGLSVTYDLYLGTSSTPSLWQSDLYNGWYVLNSDGTDFLAFATTYIDCFVFSDSRVILNRLTTYYWKVIAKVSDGSEISSQVYNFTTGEQNTLPSSPAIIYPANNATNVESENLTITWTESTDAENDPVTYNVYLGTDKNSMTLEASNLINLEYTIPYTLADQQKYYLSVKAVDGYDGSEVANTNSPYTFTVENYINDAPGAVTLSTPENNSVNTTCNVTLKWYKPYDKDGDVLYYDVYLDNNPTPATLIASGLTSLSKTVELENRYSTYYWKVVAKDNNGGQSESPVYSFTPWKNKPNTFIETVKVESGSFSMGQSDPNIGYTGYSSDEQPVHTVKLDSFLIGKYEVTWSQFCDFLNSIKESVYIDYTVTSYSGRYVVKSKGFLGNSDVLCFIACTDELKASDYEYPKIYYANDSFQVKVGFDNYPVENVNHKGAQLFCKWVGGRLPTEAEWEYAARGGNQSAGYTYSGSNSINDVGWYHDNSENLYNPMLYPHLSTSLSKHGTFKVGLKQPNELDIYDMTGNVAELVSDWYQEDYYSVSPSDNPQGPESMPEDDPAFIYRGGSWFNYYYESRNCTRYRVQYGDDYYMKDFRGLRYAANISENYAPVKANLFSPTDNTSGINSSITLKWQSFTDPEEDLTAYDVYLGTSSDPTTRITRNTLDTTVIFSDLSDNTTYYWKVVAKDNQGNSTESDTWSFSTSTIQTYTLSGIVTSEFGTPITDVELIGFDSEITTDENGEFSVEVTAGWTGIIQPYKLDYSFTPEIIELNDIQQNISGIAITAHYTYHYDVVIYVTDGNGDYMTNVEMRANNGTISPSTYTWYYKAVDAGWTATIVPVLEGYTFSPATYQVDTLEEDLTLYFSATYVGTYTISGNISDISGNPLSGANLTGFTETVITNANGDYSAIETGGWSGTIVPQLNGYTFSPESVTISSLNVNTTQDFVASEVTETVYSVIFNITDGTNPVTNATVTFDGTSYSCNSNGIVTITNISDGSYSYTVSANGYNSENGTITVSGSNVTENISLEITTVPEYFVTFSVSNNNNPITGAIISFNGSTYLTSSEGKYTIENVTAGTYKYSVSATGFESESGTITVSESDVTEEVILEIATESDYSLTFNVSDGTNPISGAVIKFIDSTYTTSSDGKYIIENVKAGTYNYSVSATGFENMNGSVTVNNADLTENITMIKVTSFEEIRSNKIVCYPNPVKNILNIESSSNIKKIQITSQYGETVFDCEVYGTYVTVGIQYIPSGIYILRIETTENNVLVKKIIKE